MNYRNTTSRFAAGAFCAVVLSHYLLAVPAMAANPPAQGPPASTPDALSVPVDALSGMLLTTINKIVDAQNAALAANPSYKATISAFIQAHTPYMTTSTHPNQPNQFYADVPFTVTYQVTNIQAQILDHWVSYPFDRTITQEIDLEATCEGWFTGSGTLTYTAIQQEPYLQGDHSFAEDAFGALLLNIIPSYVDSAIRDSLKTIPTDPTTTSNGVACRSLGVATRDQGFPFNSVEFDRPIPHLPVGTPLQEVVVRIASVKRLELRDASGNPVYNPVEVPLLDFYAGNSHIRLRLPGMAQGQTVVPTAGNIVQTPVPDPTGSLVLIANMSSGNDDVNADHAFVTFGSATHFGNGTHTLVTPKHWIQPVTQQGVKHAAATGPGYIITLEISAPLQQSTTH